MRVLAIRGANLASLKGAFEVDLSVPPLAGAGLFAIAGPTGAGKSTLLDALCLALFDRIPRLLDARPVEIGRDGDDEAGRERGNDVRAILRRGSAVGFAEVDFIGQDGRRYRSRWSVRRARNLPRGALQAQTLVLTDLATGQTIGETRSDTLKEIEGRLGLNLDQFRRAVLLAQGDFAAFLKANADERSNLLERITGLDIYTRLSIAAHERGNQEEQECRMIEQRLADTQPLEPEARKALEAEVEAEAAGVRRLEAEAAALQRAQEWADRLAGLQAEEAEGVARLEEGRELQARSGPRRDYLRAVESAQPLRPMAHAAEQARQEHGEAVGELELVNEKIKLSHTAMAAAEEALKVAEQERESAVRQRREATPQLNRARELDTLLAQAVARAKEQQLRLNAPREALQGARTRLDGLAAEQTEVVRETTEVRDWLDARAAYQGLARDWGRWDAELKRFLRFSEGLREVHEAIKHNQIELERTQRHLREGALQVARASGEREVAEAELRRLELERKGIDFDELRQQRKQQQQRRDRLKEALDLHQRAVDATQRLARLRAEAETLQGAIDQARQTLVALGEELKAREAARGEAQYAWTLAVAADNESAEAMRALLRDGDPCPVCGSLGHPWRGGHEARSRQVEALRTRLDELEETMRALGERRAQAEESQRQGERRLRQLREEEGQLQAEADRIETQWQALDCKERNPRPPATEQTLRVGLRQALEETEVVLAEISTREEQGHSITAQLERVRARHQELVREEQTHQEAHRGFETELAQTQAQRQQMEGRQTDLAQELEGVLEALGTPLQGITGWRQALEQGPEAFVEQCERRVGERQKQEARLERLSLKVREIEAAILPLQAEVRALEEQCQRQEAAATQAREHLDDLQGQRQLLFSGRPVTEIDAELDQAESRSRKAVEVAQSVLHQRRTQAATDKHGLGHWEKELRRRELTLDNARRRLDQALSERGLEATALAELIAHDVKWIQTESTALRAIDRQVAEAEALLKEREARRVRHQDAAPDLDLETLPVRREEVEAAINQARHRWAELHGGVRSDDERRERGGALREELRARARRRELWAGLRELVGSHDGKKFRIFAQGLTLEILLGHANQHLLELAPRYRLERAPGHDLDIQVVDRDMGDEVRSVHSLSGGESFLASLALALGLASLAADTTRIDSLFIDEGFGSLDPDTLDVALSALDALQAQGRIVGVISHVPALVERIGVQVRVEREGGGRSRVIVCGPHALAV